MKCAVQEVCVQDFVMSPHFTQRNFFSDSGIAMLAESEAICVAEFSISGRVLN